MSPDREGRPGEREHPADSSRNAEGPDGPNPNTGPVAFLLPGYHRRR